MTIKTVALILALLASISTQIYADTEIITKGEEIYLGRCEYCHGDGPLRAATRTLSRKYKGTSIPAPLADRTNLTPELIELFVRTATPSMAPIRKTEISDEELSWLIAYLIRNNK